MAAFFYNPTDQLDENSEYNAAKLRPIMGLGMDLGHYQNPPPEHTLRWGTLSYILKAKDWL